jgi:hypothetical protein
MKRKLFTFLAVIMTTMVVIAQQVPRDKVILELFTADW